MITRNGRPKPATAFNAGKNGADWRDKMLADMLENRAKRENPIVKAARLELAAAAPGELRPCSVAPSMFDAIREDEQNAPQRALERLQFAEDDCLACPVFVQCRALAFTVLREETNPSITGLMGGVLVDKSATGRLVNRHLAEGLDKIERNEGVA